MNRFNISAWSIRCPIPSIVLFLVLGVVGVASFLTLGVDDDPNIDVPMVGVTVSEPGAAPSELETQVTRRIEDAIAGVGNIKHIRSTIKEGVSSTNVDFELGTSADRATNDVRDAVSRIRQQLPQSINDPQVQRIDWGGGWFVQFAVRSDRRSMAELSWLVDNDISRALLAVPGVGQVTRGGGTDREIRVSLDPMRLEAVGLTADMVNQQLRALNVDMPGGRGDIGDAEQSIRTLGSARSLAQLRTARISLPSGWARLDSLGAVTDGAAEPRRAALLNGRPIVSFGVVRSTGTNMVDVEKRVDAALERLRASLPADVHIDKLQTDTKWVMESYQSSVESLVLGAALAVLVIWLFLRDWRAAMISALAMPLSVIPTFAALKWAGFTLNSMSLLGFALVVGILVDDAIVEIENIVRHIHMGKSSRTAALEAADEIGLAVVATTATIVVVFLPVAFMGGIPGQYFKQFGLTVAVAVFFSLLVARLLTPMMAAWWLREPRHEANRDRSLLTRTYDAMLEWAMANRLATVMMAVGFFVFSLMLFQNMPTSLFSDSDVGITSVSLEQPPGASLDQMLSATRRACDILQGHPDVDKVIARIGDGAAVNSASITVVLKPRESRQKTQQQIEDELRPALSRISGTRASFGNADSFRGKIKIVLASDDGEALTRAADALTDEMRGLPGLFDVRSTAALTQPEIVVRPDVALAAEQGVSVATIARTAMIATMGDIDQNLARFDLPDRQIYIRVQLDPKWRGNIQAIRDLKVVGSGGRLVPLSAVAEVTMGQGPSQIDRYDRHRQVSVSASLAPGFTLGDADAAVHKLAAMKNLPAGVFDVASGALEVQRDVFGGFVWAMGSAVLFIYAVLVLLFSDFLQPLTIMVPLPLSIGGALMGLMAAHQSLGFFSLIGIVMLMGLATKNSILLVEYALMAMHEGQLRDRAIIESGEARMRPILMTTIAMIAGMLPIALGIGAGSEARSPMAIAVVGGLVTSTLLTLIVVPVVFTYVDDFRQWARRLLFRDR